METLFKNLQQKHVCILGDLYLDEFIDCSAAGLSSEGPYPELVIEEKHLLPSVAGYIATLLSAWGVRTTLIAMTGRDHHARIVKEQLQGYGVNTSKILQSKTMLTKSQTRIRVRGDHYPSREITTLRTRTSPPLTGSQTDQIIKHLKKTAADCDAFVIADKDGNILTDDITEAIESLARQHGILKIGDPATRITALNNFDALVVNEDQLLQQIRDEDDRGRAARRLQQETACSALYLTLGAAGILYSDGREQQQVPTETHDVFDVTGAGESVAAAVTLGALQKIGPLETAKLANLVAGVAISRPGLAMFSVEDIIHQYHALQARQWAAKVVDLDELVNLTGQAKKEDKTVVWTNGCYDLVHAGHILYLEKAKSLGDILIVGLNSDRSVRLSKGPNRPIVPESQRAKLMSALSFVDYVIVFDDQSPLNIIDKIKPHIYAKGGDYDINSINQEERTLVEGYGGKIVLLPGVRGMSTTNLIEKILKTYKDEQ
ncbi:adenylyltransferase/cytidyltransferase family protein [candidate division KSB1 bacterium]|nr:adenylyltransferase/cytidyltransferase family protein [candidate division KSB1 bacterium]